MRPFASVVLLIGFLSCLAAWTAGPGIPGRADSKPKFEAAPAPAADSFLLDAYPGANAAYSLRRLRSDYGGPAVRIRRASDDSETDVGFTESGWVDTTAISDFASGSDAYVVRWYAQVATASHMTQSQKDMQPRIAEGGDVETDAEGRPTLHFDGDLLQAEGFGSALPLTDYTMWGVVDGSPPEKGEDAVFGIGTFDDSGWETAAYRYWQSYVNHAEVRHSGSDLTLEPGKRSMVLMRNTGSVADLWQGNTKRHETTDPAISVERAKRAVSVGTFEGTVGEVVFYPSVSEDRVFEFYRNVTSDWEVGPAEWNREAILPQKAAWQVTLYDWLETLSVEDVTLPEGDLRYDYSYSSADELSDVWLKTRHLTASSVTRRSPGWYVLDNGSGKGIEATGVVRANHTPRGGDYGGNPPRSWQNEPAYWYKLSIPLADGGEGNPWHGAPSMGRRAMAVSITDLTMHQGLNQSGSFNWFDMKGKAFLGMAEAYRWAGDVLPPEVQDAYEKGMEEVVDDLTARGPRAVNTNMDMFALHGAADLYVATDDPALKSKCIGLVKRALFGYVDGKLGTRHKVFAAGSETGGTFDPSGFIMEGDQPDIFYGGESIYQLAGALQAVTDRKTGSVPSEWAFLEEVVRRLQEWRTYQMFYDPGEAPSGRGAREATLVTAGAGFSGRTSHGVPNGQGGQPWKSLTIATRYPDNAFKGFVPSVSQMENDISSTLRSMSSKMDSTYGGEPDEWSGWSPWTKKTPYLPPEGWYSELRSLKDARDPRFIGPPAAREGATWNKTFGGAPTGKEYWSYKQEGPNGQAFGFFVEAQAQQGTYGGWYGGKIETFWTESTGVLLLNRHGKSGCDRTSVNDYDHFEDSTCWFNLDEKAGHHVWGRDEHGNGFTTLLLRGRELERTSSFNTDGSPPTVQVTNVFNDPSQPAGRSGISGEETGSEIEGRFRVKNTFEARADGVEVTHLLTSDQTDRVTSLWASLPVYLRYHNPYRAGTRRQEGLSDTSIEYWTGSAWQPVPEDTGGDGVPELVRTTALRLGRDYELGDGVQYAYVSLSSSRSVRLSKHKYYDPYQSKTSVRTVHIDLHGNPGTTKALPAEEKISYTIQTTKPALGGEETGSQEIFLRKGWNLVSGRITPSDASLSSVFSDVAARGLVVENESGQQFRPGENVNEIGDWEAGEAYLVHVGSESTLSIEGTPVGSRSISLKKGWNWVPYLGDTAAPASEALSSIAESLVMVKNETGAVYYPEKGVDKIGMLKPGEGYKVYVRTPVTLEYPDGS